MLAVVGMLAAMPTFAQTPGVKGSGEVFYLETFGWENPADPKGWTAPEGFYFIDSVDLGYNFVWWPGDLGFVSKWTQDPPLQTTTQENGMIANFLEKYNEDAQAELNLDNYIVFPDIDCSGHGSVVVRYETHFMAYSVADLELQVSVDGGVRWAIVDVSFGCGHKDRPLDKGPGTPAIFEANISDVCAGMPNVTMRFRWYNTRLYYWAFDDFSLAEAWDYDMKIDYMQIEWDDGDEFSTFGWIHNIPKNQLDGVGGFMNFETVTLNFGEYDQEDVYLDLDITKNGVSQFQKTSEPRDVYILYTDTLHIDDKYSPTEFGHYKVAFDVKSDVEDNAPANNMLEAFFNVTDSVYSRSDDSNELDWSMSKEAYTTEALENLNHFAGSIFPIFGDCEVDGISVFITGGKADDLMWYRFTLYFVPLGTEDETPFELLTTDYVQLDSAVFNKWTTMEFYKDGESEFLYDGDLVYAGIQFDNLNEDYLVRRNKGLLIGTDRSVKMTEGPAVAIYDGNIRTGVNDYFGKRNLMVRLLINDHSNLVDGVDLTQQTASLGQNFPNPFNRSTEISYELVNGSDVTFQVMDLTGRKVLEVNEGYKPSGKHTFGLDAGDLQAGVYFYTLRAGSYTETKQMVITQ
jgi:hypothetical protein